MNAYPDGVEKFRYYIVVITKYFKSYWGQILLIMEHWPQFFYTQKSAFMNKPILFIYASNEPKSVLIGDVESLHTFAHIINRTRRRDIGNFTLREPETLKVSFTPEQQERFDRKDGDLYNELYFDDSPYWRKNANLISNILKRVLTTERVALQ